MSFDASNKSYSSTAEVTGAHDLTWGAATKGGPTERFA
jgi:hypothetical protein